MATLTNRINQIKTPNITVTINRNILYKIIIHLEEQLKLYENTSRAYAYAHGALHAYHNLLDIKITT